ncbi:hypothetical protein ACIP66_20800 [Pseudomonas sp. NPDC088429]|uniref:hypothetical protein n=1 Tax=Pseudomonas sp. NPDC088429 TaxID=3364455 RepID=UPI00380340E9
MPEIEYLPVGAAEGCDLLIFKKPDQKIAAFGSSYRERVGAAIFFVCAKVGRLLAIAAVRLLWASKVCFKGTRKTGGSLSVTQQCPHKPE